VSAHGVRKKPATDKHGGARKVKGKRKKEKKKREKGKATGEGKRKQAKEKREVGNTQDSPLRAGHGRLITGTGEHTIDNW